MNITNKEIIIIFIVLIIIVFITNFDVYVVTKGENICSKIKMIKRPIPLIPQLNKHERKIQKETFKNLTADGYYYKFRNINPQKINLPILSDYKLPSNISFEKASVINSVIRVLSTFPTLLSNDEVKNLLNFYVIRYNSSKNINEFIDLVTSSAEINVKPYNSKYSKLIMVLIMQFNTIMLSKNVVLIGNKEKSDTPLFANPNAGIASEPPQMSNQLMIQNSQQNYMQNSNSQTPNYMAEIEQQQSRNSNLSGEPIQELESYNNTMDDYQLF